MNDFLCAAPVNQVEKDIKNMKIKDPVDGLSVSQTLNERVTAEQTNQDPCELRDFLKTSERCKKGISEI